MFSIKNHCDYSLEFCHPLIKLFSLKKTLFPPRFHIKSPWMKSIFSPEFFCIKIHFCSPRIYVKIAVTSVKFLPKFCYNLDHTLHHNLALNLVIIFGYKFHQIWATNHEHFYVKTIGPKLRSLFFKCSVTSSNRTRKKK